MTAPEFDQKLANLLHREPFEPFSILLKNGKKLEITNPLWVSYRNGHAYRATSKYVGEEFTFEQVSAFARDIQGSLVTV